MDNIKQKFNSSIQNNIDKIKKAISGTINENKSSNINVSNNNLNNSVNLNTPYVMIPVYLFILLLIIITFLIIYNVPLTINTTTDIKSVEAAFQNTFIVLFFIFLLFVLCITLLPNLKNFKTFLFQIKNVMYVILYVIFLIVFFRSLPTDILNSYSGIIISLTILIATILFYYCLKTNYIDEFNVNYERIKIIILFFCLITLFIVYYTSDPGGYITKYFGYSSTLVIVLSIFIFLYLLVLLTLPETITKPNSENLFSNFTKTSVFGSIAFIIFIIAVTISLNRGETISSSNMTYIIILLLLICILWSIILIFNLFPETINNSIVISNITFFKKILLVLFSLVIVSLIIAWIVYNVNNYAGQSSIINIILNVILILLVLIMVYKTFIVKLPYGNSKKNSFFNLIINIIFYIPCIFTDAYDYIYKIISNTKSEPTPKNSVFVLVIIIMLLVSYLIFPSLLNKMYLQGGKVLVDVPIYINQIKTLGTYEDLNGSSQYDYQCSISFWVFLDSEITKTSTSYTNYTSILNFGEKPNVLYNASNNTLMITMQQKGLNKNKNTELNKLIDFDDNGNRIIYKNNNMLLQKWNNIIINYNGGNLDIFLNGELVKSALEVVPYYTLDNLTVGENNGINGGLCNLIYFNKALTTNNIYYLYNMVKNKDPPIMNNINYK